MRHTLVALVTGALVAFAFAPYGFYPLIFLCVGTLFYLWQNTAPRRAAWLGFWFGLGMFGHGAWWIQVSIHQFGLPLYSFSVTTTALFVLIMALYPALAGYLCRRLPAQTEIQRLCLLAPALWVFTEWLRGWLFSGFPWLNLGYSQTDSWLAGLAPMFGAYGVSLACALIAAGLGALLARRWWLGGGLVIAIVAFSAVVVRVNWTTPEGAPFEVALVQGAIPQAIKWNPAYRQPTLNLYAALSAPHWGKALMIWPESAIPAFPDEIESKLADFGAEATRAGTALLVGMPTGDRRRGPYYNSVVLLNRAQAKYDKHHLVPYGEYLPFNDYLRPLFNFLTIPMSDFTAGAARQLPIVHQALRIGVSICYEDAYTEEVTKALPAANVLVNVSDDAWFGDSIAPHQHLQISRMRAIEAGRYLLRATNNGISAVIDQRGRVRARSPQFRPYVLTGAAHAYTGPTPFVRFGNYPVFAIAAGLLFVAWRRARA